MTSSAGNDQPSDLVKNDSVARDEESTEITIDTYNATGMNNSSQYHNAMLSKKEKNRLTILPSWWVVATRLVKRTNTWSFIISWVILLFLLSLCVKCFQMTCICLDLLNAMDTSTAHPLNFSHIECAYTRVVISSGNLEHYLCDTGNMALDVTVANIDDDDLIRLSQIHTFRLLMCILLPVSVVMCAIAIPSMKRAKLLVVCISSSILVSHSFLFILLLVISYNSFNQLPILSIVSISLDLCIALSVLISLQVHELHSIMYFNPQMCQRHHQLNQRKLDCESHSRLYSIKRITSTDNVNDKTYHKFDHVDTSFDS